MITIFHYFKIKQTMAVIVLALLLISHAIADDNIFEVRETPNIRHGRSRARLLRTSHHDDGEEYPDNILDVKTAPRDEFKKSQTSSPVFEFMKKVGGKTENKQSIDRKITMDANFTTNLSVYWQIKDKDAIRHKTMDQVVSKEFSQKHSNNENYETKTISGEPQDYDIKLPQVEDSFIEAEQDAAEESVEKSTENVRSGHVDIVTRFLRIVESQHLLGENCTAGTDLNLGEGVVDRYAQERFRVEADVAVNRANMLTRLWKYSDPNIVLSEYLLHASVFSMVEFDNDIFAAGNCYDQYQYKDYWLFCPYAYRLPEGRILVKDLAVEYKYLSNTSEWFYIARKNAENVIRNYNQFSKGKVKAFCFIYHT